jgi:hypothetical protein
LLLRSTLRAVLALIFSSSDPIEEEVSLQALHQATSVL